MSAKEQLREETRTRVRVPRQYQVLIYNDDFTPMDFVVQILMEIFGKQEEEAVALMLSIHKGSSAVAGVYPKDIARTKAREAVDWAREEGFPLKVEAVSLWLRRIPQDALSTRVVGLRCRQKDGRGKDRIYREFAEGAGQGRFSGKERAAPVIYSRASGIRNDI